MKTVFVGMSGGVDSSLSAALLKQQGYNVVGAYMKNWAQDLPGFECPWREDVADAKRVAVQLGIDFDVFDFQEQYRDKVVGYMIEGYKSGITPNPDIMCNQEIKFKLFMDTALERGADMIATGHYARIGYNSGNTKSASLLTGVDDSKDQSYFLYRINQEALPKSLFPLGEFKKSEVRKRAKELGLATADKRDSTGICFIGKVPISDFLSQYVTTEPGPIIDQHGQEIGEHDGAIFYTIGQRQGLGVGGGLPYYVTGKDVDSNKVFVTSELSDDDLWSEHFTITNPNWISAEPEPGEKYSVRTRHLGELIKAGIRQIKPGRWQVTLDKPQRAISPGQSAVVYAGDLVLGGGIIG